MAHMILLDCQVIRDLEEHEIGSLKVSWRTFNKQAIYSITDRS